MIRQSSKLLKIMLTIVFLLFILCALAAVFLWHRYLPLSYEAVRYTETAAELPNPWRGFYEIYGYTLSDGELQQELQPGIQEQKTKGCRLVQLQINLKNYSDKSISAHALSQLDEILCAWSEAGFQIILRFLYDWDGNANATEPYELSIIAEHMRQTASVYNRYDAQILTLQGLYTGNFGEMHHSRFQSPGDLSTLADTLAAEAAPDIYLAVRTPRQWRSIAGKSSKAWTERLGLFNDGMLGSSTDTGTYESGSARAQEIAFQHTLCETVPNGGEVILDNPYNDGEAAVKDLTAMRISYLNSAYDPDVLTKWQNEVCRGDGPYNGRSIYEYIRDHLGYRYVIRDSAVRFFGLKDDTAWLTLSLENTGFAPSYRPFHISLTLKNPESGERIPLSLEQDSTAIPAQAVTARLFELPVRTYPPGAYEIYVSLTDDSTGEQLLLANDLSLSDCGYLIGTLKLGR